MKRYGLALGSFLSAGAQALETLGRDELLSLCRSESPGEVAVCSGCINGFLDGAFATDPGVVDRVVSEIQTAESFSERAARAWGIRWQASNRPTRRGFVYPRTCRWTRSWKSCWARRRRR